MATQTGGYPSLATVANLGRVFLNDFQNAGAGYITTDTSPQTLPALNSAIRWLYRKLRNVGTPSLIRDNVLRALPANGATGPGVQTYLSFDGYFDGLSLDTSITLPFDMMFPQELWEQQTGSGLPFVLMSQPQAGLPTQWNQTFNLGMWEWRGGANGTAGVGYGQGGYGEGGYGGVTPTGGYDALFFVGALSPVTIRMRYQAALTQFVSPVDFSTSYVPIMDCEEALAYYFAYNISRTLTGITPAIADLKQCAEDALNDLRLEQTRRAQTVEYSRQPYGSCADAPSQVGITNLI